VLQLRGGKIGQGDSGQLITIDSLRQAASAAGPRYKEASIPLPKSRQLNFHLYIQMTLDHPEHLKNHRHTKSTATTAPYYHSSLLTPHRKNISCKSMYLKKMT